MHRVWKIFSVLGAVTLLSPCPAQAEADPIPTIVVSAEGLADPNYYRDQSIAYDEALRDAKGQAVEKAVGCFVSSRTVVENYALVSDRLISKSDGLIKSVFKVVNGGVQADGFYHVWIKAEIFAKPLSESLNQLSGKERSFLIKERGNPVVSVGILVESPESGERQECHTCNTEISSALMHFGYRVISDKKALEEKEARIKMMVSQGYPGQLASTFIRKMSDISVMGMVNLRKSPKINLAGIDVQTTLLTAWSLEAVDNHTSQIIFARNFQPPRGVMYNNEDEAVLKVGKQIGEVFSKDLFKSYIMRPSHEILMIVSGFEDRSLAKMLKKELIGVRAVLNVNFKEFLAGGETVFDVEFAGGREHFSNIVEDAVLGPLNRKFGKDAFHITEEHGDILRIAFDSSNLRQPFEEVLEEGAPLQLVADAPPERLREVVKSEELKQKVVKANPDAGKALMDL
ncbi:conserved exported hypothetical protein [uncultured Desulfatiglans sp.]|uniref:Flagellar assembly protein T N-terminal domain-containing protein n=1 Tax=Uncultured Desulfatiglans sp. TaxID=1748965 RepID=A0A653A1A0_UNCDX|nr:conserved exported hypothetical protein [uncultured Desulfatiglans sp.]